jgi:hypothetical protein
VITHDCHTKSHSLECLGQTFSISTWKTLKGEFVAQLAGEGCEIRSSGESRGEALLTLADFMHSALFKIRMHAFETEGAFKNPNFRDD